MQISLVKLIAILSRLRAPFGKERYINGLQKNPSDVIHTALYEWTSI